MQIALLMVALSLLAASLVPLFRHEVWWIRVFDFPRLQILLLSVATGVLMLLWGDVASPPGVLGLMAAGAGALLQGLRVLPYTVLAPKEVLSAVAASEAQTLSLLVANVYMGNRRYERLLALIERYRPDIVLLLEPDGAWERAMDVLESEYPFSVREALDNEYGMLLYSRLPLVESQIRYLLREGIPSMHMQVRLRSGTRVWLHAVHPEPPSPTEAETSLPRDAELLMVGRAVKDRGAPTIVAGDLNDVAWSYTTTLFQRISGLLDPRKGRGMFNTFNARLPFMRWPLDHVFHSEHFFLGEMRRLPAFGSDHFPVYVRLVLQPGAESLHEVLAAGDRDNRVADEKVRAGFDKPKPRPDSKPG